MWIEILADTVADRKAVKVGDVVDVSNATGRLLTSMQPPKAKKSEEPKPPAKKKSTKKKPSSPPEEENERNI